MRLLFITLLFVFAGASFVIAPAWAGFIDHPQVKLQFLDKATARTVTLEAKVGSTVEYGSTFIKIQACRKSEPLDKPESAAFLQVWEVPIGAEKSEWLFSGWMFASSPALSAMDHPVYDIWVLDCKGEGQQPEVVSSETIPSDVSEETLAFEDADVLENQPDAEN